ncbi:fibronectin type III domain-containing protein [Rouxiella chamberiensis]|nr:fibronectin type III domain-containing protein [Rouxiella chamberiensis]
MTTKTLKEMIGRNLQVDLRDDGFSVTCGAGTAQYDKWGARTTVNGVPEYFAETITVSGWDNLSSNQALTPHDKTSEELIVKLFLDTSDAEKQIEKIDELIRSTEAFALLQGHTFINSALISPVIITYAHLKPAEDAHLIGDHLPDAKQREKVKEIVGRHLTGEASEHSEEMIDELMPIVVSAITGDVHTGGTLADCKKQFGGSEPMPFGDFPGAKECQAQAEKPQLPEIISTNSVPFGVTVSWKGPKNIPEGSKIQVQWIKDDYFLSTTDHKVVSGENSHTITGLKSGEEIDCRLRVVSALGQKSEWSQFVKQSASSDATELLTAIYPLKVGVSDHREMKSPDELTEKVKAIIRGQLKPGGVLWR